MNLPRERRQFGQNFLVDEAVCQSIARDIDPHPQGITVEIGPGDAAITRLLGKSGRIVAIEIDPKWATKLSDKWGKILPITVVNKDALLVDLDPLLSEGPSGLLPVLCGNLPYNRATPIILRFVTRIRDFRHMLFMVQYEVAKRLCAVPGRRDFGSLSVQVQNYATCELRDVIGPEAFRPRPKVHSATVRLVARPAPLCTDPRFPRFVREAFLHKRKTLVNALTYVFTQDIARAGLAKTGVPEDVRAEQVPLEDWVRLFEVFASELPALPEASEEPLSE